MICQSHMTGDVSDRQLLERRRLIDDDLYKDYNDNL